MKKYLKRLTGCLLLPFFPLILFVDRMFGFMVTGVPTRFNDSCQEIWSTWFESYWKCEDV